MSKIIITLDSSQVVQFLECPQKWYFRYHKRLIPQGQRTEALDKGSLMHGLLDYYYNLRWHGKDWLTSQKLSIQFLEEENKNWNLEIDQIQFVKKRFTEYCIYYSQGDIRPLTNMNRPAVELGFSYPLVDNEHFLFVIEGRIDLIVDAGNGIKCVVDHKTQSAKRNLNKYRPQFKTYSMVTDIPRVMVNYIGLQDTLKPEYLRREIAYFNPHQIQEWRKKLEYTFYRLSNSLIHNSFEKSENSCESAYGICPYLQLCECSKSNQENLINLHYEVTEKWSPWEINELKDNKLSKVIRG